MISVVIPTYRPSNYIVECISCLARQSLNFSQFEILIVLNGSYEPYWSYLEHIKCMYNELDLKIYYTSERGVSNARNIGISKSNYNYIVFIDDDDLISENMLTVFLSYASPSSLVVSPFKTFYDSITTLSDDYVSKAFLKCKNKKYSLLGYRGFLSSACGKLIPKEVIGNNFFNTNVPRGEDALFMFGISKTIKNVIIPLEEIIYFRRKNLNSASRRKVKFINDFLNSIKLVQLYTFIFFQAPLQYSFLFYLTRIGAIGKVFIKRLLR